MARWEPTPSSGWCPAKRRTAPRVGRNCGCTRDILRPRCRSGWRPRAAPDTGAEFSLPMLDLAGQRQPGQVAVRVTAESTFVVPDSAVWDSAGAELGSRDHRHASGLAHRARCDRRSDGELGGRGRRAGAPGNRRGRHAAPVGVRDRPQQLPGAPPHRAPGLAAHAFPACATLMSTDGFPTRPPCRAPSSSHRFREPGLERHPGPRWWPTAD